jgi:hypothetical protein
MLDAPSTPTLASHTSGRTVYFDPSFSTCSLGLALKAFVSGPNGLPLGAWERTIRADIRGQTSGTCLVRQDG